MRFFTSRILGFIFALAATTITAQAYSNGSITGVTASGGCGNSGCHGASSTTTTVSQTSGATTVNTGSTTTFTIQVAHTSQAAAGIDIAVKTTQTGSTSAGTLTPESGSGLQANNNELTHSGGPKTMSGGSASFTFTWTAPTTAGTYYLRAVGNAVNNNNSNSGDNWNFMTPIAITVNAQATLALSAPVSGAVWCAGSTQNITWTSSGVSTIKIEVSTDGSTYAPIAMSVSASAGTYSYTIPSNAPTGNQYRVRITDNNNATLTSTSSPFTVAGAPAITTQPSPQSICPGLPASFSVATTGGANTFQWYKDGQIINGATTSTYSISSVSSANAGRYSVIVSSPCGSPVTSSEAILTVGAGTTITSSPTSQTVCINQTVVLTVAATGSNLTYQWNKGGSPISGATQSSYSVTMSGTAQEGVYTATVTGGCGMQSSAPATLTLGLGPVVTTQPQSQAVTAGTNVTFTAAATDAKIYQWRKNGLNINNTTPTLTLTNVQVADTGSYDLRIVNDCGATVTTAAKLTIVQPGAGAILSTGSNSLDFGNSLINTPVEKTLVISNTGDSVLNVSSVTITGAGAANYSIVSGGAPFNIAPNFSHSIGIRFNGTTAGTFAADLNFQSNAKVNPVIALSGVLKTPESPVLSIENTRFDTTDIGANSTNNVRVRNTGTVPAVLSSVAIEGANAAQFSIVAPFNAFVLNAGEFADIAVRFTPATQAEATAVLRVVAEGGDLTANLSGYGRLVNSADDIPSYIQSMSVMPNPASDVTIVKIDLLKAQTLDITVVNALGETVQNLLKGEILHEGNNSIRWNGLNANGSKVAAGMYRIIIRSENSMTSIPVSVIR